MSLMAVVHKEDEQPPRAKVLAPRATSAPLAVTSHLPPADLFFRPGARELLLPHLPELRPLITEARTKVAEIFGGSARVVLERHIDPDEPIAEPMLYLVIVAEISVDDAMSGMDRFYDEWWLDNACRAWGKMAISTELW